MRRTSTSCTCSKTCSRGTQSVAESVAVKSTQQRSEFAPRAAPSWSRLSRERDETCRQQDSAPLHVISDLPIARGRQLLASSCRSHVYPSGGMKLAPSVQQEDTAH